MLEKALHTLSLLTTGGTPTEPRVSAPDSNEAKSSERVREGLRK